MWLKWSNLGNLTSGCKQLTDNPSLIALKSKGFQKDSNPISITSNLSRNSSANFLPRWSHYCDNPSVCNLSSASLEMTLVDAKPTHVEAFHQRERHDYMQWWLSPVITNLAFKSSLSIVFRIARIAKKEHLQILVRSQKEMSGILSSSRTWERYRRQSIVSC